MSKKEQIQVSAIAALGRQRQIGKDNQLLWHIPEDMKRFKRLTSGKAVIMGRKTWESLPKSVRPLPGRENIILTRNKKYEAEGGVIKHYIEQAVEYGKEWSKKNRQNEVFIIGGATIYEQALPLTDRLYLTLVDSNKSGDTFFPEYRKLFKTTKEVTGSKDNTTYHFVTLERK